MKNSVREKGVFFRLRYGNGKIIAISLFAAIGILLICSTCSPLYAYNQWMDANIYFTVGRGMAQGLVPYRDLIDHKGPVLFFIQMLGALINSSSFFGVWLLEIAAAAGYLFFSAKTVQLFAGESAAVLSVPLLAMFAYTTNAFARGSSAEEFVLPLLAFSLYLFCRTFQTESRFRPGGWLLFLNGVGAGLIMWIKYTMLGAHFAWMAALALLLWLKDKSFAKAVKASLVFLSGMAAVTVLVLAYFAVNRALGDLFQVYFVNNIFDYASEAKHWSEPIYNLLMSGLETLWRNPLVMGLCGIGLAAVFLDCTLLQLWGRIGFAGMMFFQGLFIWGATRGFPYYGLVFVCFSCLGLAALFRLGTRRLALKGKVLGGAAAGLLGIAVLFGWVFGEYVPEMAIQKEELPQAQVASVLKQEGAQTLLGFGFADIGFYTVANIMPTCPYFSALNLSDTTKLDAMAYEMMQNGDFDFVITLSKRVPGFLIDQYALYQVFEGEIAGESYSYNLYKNKSL